MIQIIDISSRVECDTHKLSHKVRRMTSTIGMLCATNAKMSNHFHLGGF